MLEPLKIIIAEIVTGKSDTLLLASFELCQVNFDKCFVEI